MDRNTTLNTRTIRRLDSRRTFLGALGLGLAAATLDSGVAVAQCVNPAPVNEDCPKSVGFVMHGSQVIKQFLGDRLLQTDSDPKGPVGADLRLSLRQAPEQTYMWGTFKPSENGAILVRMGPIKNGVEPAKRPLDLVGERFELSGCFRYDGEALVEECGVEVLRPGWIVDVERILKQPSGLVFRYEYSFGISPDCGDAQREYLNTIDRQVPVPAPAPQPVPAPATPAEGTGRPGRQPAQVPVQLPRSGGGSDNAPSTNLENNPRVTPWPTQGR